MEVARLVAEGLTNRQIAERLYISERTAEYHVEQTRNKLGFHSRAEIAHWVTEAAVVHGPSRLPVQFTTFVGRGRETAGISSLLGRSRLVTITGAAGTGKTRLAVEVASRVNGDFADGASFVDLQSLDDGNLLAAEVATALGLADLDNDLASKRLLIVLDNCEQIIAACRDLVRKMLSSSAGLKVLATSREPLHVAGEAVWPLQPMTPADGVDLFLDRARLAAPDVAIEHADPRLIESICRDLDCIPLAIELAASRTRVMSLTDMRGRLQSRFRLLVGGDSASRRQQTLEAAVAWSNDLLLTDEKLLFNRLGIFSGDFFLESAQAVVADSAIPADRVPKLLDGLVDRSLVVAERKPDRTTKYRLLVTMRDFARERLVDAGALEAMRGKHVSHYDAQALRADRELRGPNQAEWMRRIEDELDEFRSAMSWALEQDPATTLEIATGLGWYWGMGGRVSEGRHWLAAALPKASSPTLMYGKALIHAGWLARLQGETEVGASFHTQSLEVLRQFDDPVELGLGLVWNAEAASSLDDWKTAREGWTEAIDLLEPLGPSEPLAYAMLELGMADIRDRAAASARARARRGMSIMAQLGNVRGEALGRMVMGYAAYIDGDLAAAWTEITECLATLHRIGAVGDLNLPLSGAVVIAVAMGRHELGVSLAAAREGLGSVTGWTQPSSFLGDVERSALAEARARLGEEGYKETWERGFAMSADDAVNLVLRRDSSLGVPVPDVSDPS